MTHQTDEIPIEATNIPLDEPPRDRSRTASQTARPGSRLSVFSEHGIDPVALRSNVVSPFGAPLIVPQKPSTISAVPEDEGEATADPGHNALALTTTSRPVRQAQLPPSFARRWAPWFFLAFVVLVLLITAVVIKTKGKK